MNVCDSQSTPEMPSAPIRTSTKPQNRLDYTSLTGSRNMSTPIGTDIGTPTRTRVSTLLSPEAIINITSLMRGDDHKSWVREVYQKFGTKAPHGISDLPQELLARYNEHYQEIFQDRVFPPLGFFVQSHDIVINELI
jgi:hypothetical protein